MSSRKTRLFNAPTKPVELSCYVGIHGRSTVKVKCPWCGHRTIAYSWSLAGSGKRCDNDKCRALLTPTVAIKDIAPLEGGQ